MYKYGSLAESSPYLRDLKMKPRDREQPDETSFIRTSPYRRWLYSTEHATPRRVPTELQRQAIARMREGLVLAYTCQLCG
jgi:hypothetical protein